MKTVLGFAAVFVGAVLLGYLVFVPPALLFIPSLREWTFPILAIYTLIACWFAFVAYQDRQQSDAFTSAFHERYMPEPGPAEAAWLQEMADLEAKESRPRLGEPRHEPPV